VPKLPGVNRLHAVRAFEKAGFASFVRASISWCLIESASSPSHVTIRWTPTPWEGSWSMLALRLSSSKSFCDEAAG